jgi:uncharacterized protein
MVNARAGDPCNAFSWSKPLVLAWPFPIEPDPEGDKVPPSLPFIVDAHVHLFPDPLFGAIWQWFEGFAWSIRYKLSAADIIDFLLSRGIGHIVALHYAHKPGIARSLNAFMADLCSLRPQVTGTATVFPAEEDARAILEEAFQLGLHGVKLHAHVQCFRMDSDAMHEICEVCVDYGKPLVMHVGREPKIPDYPYTCDPYSICRSDKLEQILVDYPGLKVCVPHLGANEFTAYKELLERYDNLWLDVSMAIADYLPNSEPPRLADMRVDRIMYGTDFPHIPYAWDRELKHLCELGLPEESMELILGRNAVEFFSISIQS